MLDLVPHSVLLLWSGGGKEVLVCADLGGKRQVPTHGSPGFRVPGRKLEMCQVPFLWCRGRSYVIT